VSKKGIKKPWGIVVHHPTGGWHFYPTTHFKSFGTAKICADKKERGRYLDEIIVTVKVGGIRVIAERKTLVGGEYVVDKERGGSLREIERNKRLWKPETTPVT
jgi:hypothetical protein